MPTENLAYRYRDVRRFPTPVPGLGERRDARRTEADYDRGLIERARTGDARAFRTLVDRHQRRAFAVALSLVKDEDDARELVQEAFLRVFRGLRRFQGESTFFTWLYRIVKNLAIDFLRRPLHHGLAHDDGNARLDAAAPGEFPFPSPIDGSEPLDVVRRREIAARLMRALDDLPPYHRGVVWMREVEGMSYEEMAVVMNVSKGTIMSRLFHARQKLKRALWDCYSEENAAHGA